MIEELEEKKERSVNRNGKAQVRDKEASEEQKVIIKKNPVQEQLSRNPKSEEELGQPGEEPEQNTKLKSGGK